MVELANAVPQLDDLERKTLPGVSVHLDDQGRRAEAEVVARTARGNWHSSKRERPVWPDLAAAPKPVNAEPLHVVMISGVGWQQVKILSVGDAAAWIMSHGAPAKDPLVIPRQSVGIVRATAMWARAARADGGGGDDDRRGHVHRGDDRQRGGLLLLALWDKLRR